MRPVIVEVHWARLSDSIVAWAVVMAQQCLAVVVAVPRASLRVSWNRSGGGAAATQRTAEAIRLADRRVVNQASELVGATRWRGLRVETVPSTRRVTSRRAECVEGDLRRRRSTGDAIGTCSTPQSQAGCVIRDLASIAVVTAPRAGSAWCECVRLCDDDPRDGMALQVDRQDLSSETFGTKEALPEWRWQCCSDSWE